MNVAALDALGQAERAIKHARRAAIDGDYRRAEDQATVGKSWLLVAASDLRRLRRTVARIPDA